MTHGLDHFSPGMRVQTIERHLGPSFPAKGGYTPQPDPIIWHGEVVRVGNMAKVVWVQWDILRPGKHNPVQASLLMREGARAIRL